jgi:TctA family transporter
MKKGFQKVGQFIKTTGAKIAKFGLKVVSAAAGVLGTVARFIPGVGSGLSAAFKGVSKGADAASNAIHANLGKKLEKGMKVMNIIEDPIGKSRKVRLY